MKKSIVSCALLLILIIPIVGCLNKKETNQPISTSIDNTVNFNNTVCPEPNLNHSDNDGNKQIKNEFSLIFGDKYFSLGDVEQDAGYSDILGQPIKEEVKVLGSGADTHTGSSIKTIEYKGIKLKLFSPKDITRFWVMAIDIYSNDFKTFRGIFIGNSVSDLKQKYEEVVQVLDGRTDQNNCAYTINKEEKYILFEVSDGIVTEIKLYVEIP